MEEDTVELRLAKVAQEFLDSAMAERCAAENARLRADVYERCAIKIRVALQQAPPPTEHPANARLQGCAEAHTLQGVVRHSDSGGEA